MIFRVELYLFAKINVKIEKNKSLIQKNSKDYFRQMILAKHSIGNNLM